ncbi:MAG: TetR/AcrR family transcriptional regulator [Proteobacteria bacterium]|nr:MAG: TetR/AcrR family transcriptional regulator [Pseudomonadota bacterium]
MKTSPKTSRGLGDKDQRILDAAKLLFGRFGLKKTSIEEIAQHAGLGKGTVYLYFKSKDEIFSVLANRMTEEYETLVDEAIGKATTPTEKIRTFIEVRVGYWDKTFRQFEATTESILEAEASPIIDEIRKKTESRRVHLISDILEAGLKTGEFSFDNSRFTALAIYHILESLVRPWNIEVADMTPEDKIEATISLLFNGILKRPKVGQA